MQTWSELVDMPGGRFTAAACVLGDNIYVFGGHDGEAEKPTSTTFRFNTVDEKKCRTGVNARRSVRSHCI
jgi:N-acetylneuraminic acid mutarotase